MRLRRPSHIIHCKRGVAGIVLLALFLGTMTLSIGLNLLLSITGLTRADAQSAGTQITSALSGYGMTVSLLLYGIVTPLLEELIFRGMLYSGMDLSMSSRIQAPRQRFLVAAGLSSILFGIYHMNLSQGIYATLMGMVFCLAYELTGQFLSAWILHAACNMIALLLSQSVNGTNAFTALCTPPWTAAFLTIAIASLATLYIALSRTHPAT